MKHAKWIPNREIGPHFIVNWNFIVRTKLCVELCADDLVLTIAVNFLHKLIHAHAKGVEWKFLSLSTDGAPFLSQTVKCHNRRFHRKWLLDFCTL